MLPFETTLVQTCSDVLLNWPLDPAFDELGLPQREKSAIAARTSAGTRVK
jgi:hypothetical protein